jgi:hypothetical protein
MTFAYGHIAQRLFDTPLMYDPRKAEAFLAGLGGRIAGGEVIVVNGGEMVEHQAFSPMAGRLRRGWATRSARSSSATTSCRSTWTAASR